LLPSAVMSTAVKTAIVKKFEDTKILGTHICSLQKCVRIQTEIYRENTDIVLEDY
jgi:hypothetical protein